MDPLEVTQNWNFHQIKDALIEPVISNESKIGY